MTRNPAGYAGTGTPVHADVHDPANLGTAMAGCQVAYYLVHSLADADIERKDAAAAAAFGQAGTRAGLQRIISSEGSATTRTRCRRTCAAAARPRSCSDRPASR